MTSQHGKDKPMSDELDDLIARLRHCSENTKDEYLHELAGRSADALEALRTEKDRTMSDSDAKAYNATPAASLEDHIMNVSIAKSEAGWWAQKTIEALRAENARLRKIRADEWNAYITEAVSKAPEPLRQLGEYLAGVLDEDQWKTAERYLNAAALGEQP